jgi:predicted neuraminidase
MIVYPTTEAPRASVEIGASALRLLSGAADWRCLAVDADGDGNAELSNANGSLNLSSHKSPAYVLETAPVDSAGWKLAPLRLGVRLVGGRCQDLEFCD